MTAHRKLTVLDRLHTLVTVGLGTVAVLVVGLSLPTPDTAITRLVWVALAMGAGYGASSLVDVSFTHLVHARREQLLAAIRQSDPSA
jgi:hypothetical protein